jgi:GntR family transcriptional regulator/MocR family aminotransferase
LYGQGDPQGYLPLRKAIAEYVGPARGVRCDAHQIIVTSGTQQALDLIARMLLDPGDAVWLEDPGYPGARFAFRAAGARIIPVPVDRQGLVVAHAAAQCPDARLAYVTPANQFPLGATMSPRRRVELLDWAASHNAWIIEDEYDAEYRYTGPPVPSLQSLDRSGCVIYVGTFTKMLFNSWASSFFRSGFRRHLPPRGHSSTGTRPRWSKRFSRTSSWKATSVTTSGECVRSMLAAAKRSTKPLVDWQES